MHLRAHTLSRGDFYSSEHSNEMQLDLDTGRKIAENFKLCADTQQCLLLGQGARMLGHRMQYFQGSTPLGYGIGNANFLIMLILLAQNYMTLPEAEELENFPVSVKLSSKSQRYNQSDDDYFKDFYRALPTDAYGYLRTIQSLKFEHQIFWVNKYVKENSLDIEGVLFCLEKWALLNSKRDYNSVERHYLINYIAREYVHSGFSTLQPFIEVIRKMGRAFFLIVNINERPMDDCLFDSDFQNALTAEIKSVIKNNTKHHNVLVKQYNQILRQYNELKTEYTVAHAAFVSAQKDYKSDKNNLEKINCLLTCLETLNELSLKKQSILENITLCATTLISPTSSTQEIIIAETWLKNKNFEIKKRPAVIAFYEKQKQFLLDKKASMHQPEMINGVMQLR